LELGSNPFLFFTLLFSCQAVCQEQALTDIEPWQYRQLGGDKRHGPGFKT
jgi:hypothetical protein